MRALAVRPDRRGRGIGAAILDAVVNDARGLGLPRVIALTREVPFFESYGFTVAERDSLPRKVWTDCVQCPRRHACDEIAVVLDLAAVRTPVPAPAEVAKRCGFPRRVGSSMPILRTMAALAENRLARSPEKIFPTGRIGFETWRK